MRTDVRVWLLGVLAGALLAGCGSFAVAAPDPVEESSASDCDPTIVMLFPMPAMDGISMRVTTPQLDRVTVDVWTGWNGEHRRATQQSGARGAGANISMWDFQRTTVNRVSVKTNAGTCYVSRAELDRINELNGWPPL